MATSGTQGKDTNTVILLNSSAYHERFTDPKKMLTDASDAMKIAQTLNYGSGIGESYRMRGIGYFYLKQPAKALIEYNAALKYFILNKDLRSQAKVYSNCGNLYMDNNFDLSLKFYRKALFIANEIKYKPLIASVNLNIGNLFYRKKDFFSALKFHKKSERLFSEVKDSVNLVLSLENLGINYYNLKQFDKAKIALLYAQKYAKHLDLSEQLASLDLILTSIYLTENKYSKAEETIQEGMLLSVSLRDKKTTGEFEQKFAGIPKNGQQISSNRYQAVRNIILYSQLNDRLVESENAVLRETQASRVAAAKFVKDEGQILAKNATIQRHYIIAGWVAAFLTISLLIGFLVYRQYHLNKLLELEKMRMNIAADFHDELGSTLSSINLYCEIGLSDNFEDKHRAKNILTTISQSSMHTVSAMKDMIWSLQPNYDTTEEMIYRMRDYSYPLAEMKGIRLEFEVGENVKKDIISMDTRKNIYLIFKEALNNAFKYAAATQISITINQQGNELQLAIKDDGSGFDPKNVVAGNGILNMRKRAEQAGGTLQITSHEGKGTAILFCCSLS
jgi:signal transduction histidine kinase